MKISLCMIVKNEEQVLARCLDSVKSCVDEIVIADTGSTDNTPAVARAYTDKVSFFPWTNDFAAARNYSFSLATGDYILWLDADDYVSEESAEALSGLKDVLESERPDMVFCPYDVAFDAQGRATSTFYRERLIRRCDQFRWQGRVHECIAPQGKIMRVNFRVTHLGSNKERGARNLHLYQLWAAEEELSGRDKFYYGRELYYNRLYTEAVAVLEDMLAGDGWYVNKIEACKILALCHLEKRRTEKALEALYKSFLYGEPRASVLCEIGKIFKQKNRLREAVFWYESALRCADHAEEGDFEEPACRDLVPLLELTYCYDALGDIKKAVSAHREAETLSPEHPSVIYNRNYFLSRGLL